MKRKTIIIAGLMALVFTMSLFAQGSPRPGQKPAVPRNLSASNVTHDKMTLQWNNVDGPGITYVISYNTRNDFNNAARSDAIRGTTFELANLSANTEYFIWIYSVQGPQTSDASAPVRQRTAAPPRQPPKPATPQQLRALGATHDRISVQWNNIDGPGITYVVSYNTRNDFNNATRSDAIRGTTFELANLSPNTEYFIWIYSVQGPQTSDASAPIRQRTDAPPPPPPPSRQPPAPPPPPPPPPLGGPPQRR